MVWKTFIYHNNLAPFPDFLFFFTRIRFLSFVIRGHSLVMSRWIQDRGFTTPPRVFEFTQPPCLLFEFFLRTSYVNLPSSVQLPSETRKKSALVYSAYLLAWKRHFLLPSSQIVICWDQGDMSSVKRVTFSQGYISNFFLHLVPQTSNTRSTS